MYYALVYHYTNKKLLNKIIRKFIELESYLKDKNILYKECEYKETQNGYEVKMYMYTSFSNYLLGYKIDDKIIKYITDTLGFNIIEKNYIIN